MNSNRPDYFGIALLTIFFLLLTYAGYLSYKSIDWTVLQRLEATKLVLPTPIPTNFVSPPASPSAKP